MRQQIRFLCVLTLLAVLGAAQAGAQVVMRHGGGEEGSDVVVLHELGAVVAPQGDGLILVALLPDVERDIALEKGDLLMMINGQRVKDLDGLRAEYEGVAVGETVKLGIRRGDERFLTSFEKAEAGPGGGRQVRMMIGGPDSDLDDVQMLQEFGVLLAEKEGQVLVAMELPGGTPAFAKEDVVASINGQIIGSLEEFRSTYEPLAIGDKVTLVVLRSGEELSASRVKAEQEGVMRVRRAN